MLVLGDHGGHALAGLIDSGRGLGGGAGDGVDVWSAEVVARVGLVGAGRSDWQVVVESSDGAGVVRQHSLGSQEWVEGLQTRVSSSRIIVMTITNKLSLQDCKNIAISKSYKAQADTPA